MNLTIERIKTIDIPINVSNKPNNANDFNRHLVHYNDSVNLYEAIALYISTYGSGGGTSGGTDLSLDRVGNTVTVYSSTGTDILLPLATTSLAGLISAEDKVKLNGALSSATLEIGDRLIGDGSQLNPLNWKGAIVNNPLTGTGTVGKPLSILNESITSVHIKDGTIQFSDWNQNGASLGDVPQWTGSGWGLASSILPVGGIGKVLLHNGTSWVGVSVITETRTGITGINLVLANTPLSYGMLQVFKNGILQTIPDEYTIVADLLVFTVNLVALDVITIIYNI